MTQLAAASPTEARKITLGVRVQVRWVLRV
jgi:hypothetical protein